MNLKRHDINNRTQIHKQNRIKYHYSPGKVASICSTVLVLAVLFTAKAEAVLPAAYPWPQWWTGWPTTNTCYASVYNQNNGNHPDATLFTTWRGIQVCGPRPQEDGGFNVPEYIPNIEDNKVKYKAYMWECAELASRYLKIAYGMNGETTGGGAAFVGYYANKYPDTFSHHINAPNSGRFPQEGDIVSFTSSDPNGHVAIVKEVTIQPPTFDGTVTFINQNGNPNESTPGIFTAQIDDYEIKDSNGFHVTDWISPRWVDSSPSVAQYGLTYDMDAISQSDVWTAGYESLPGKTRQPVTYRKSGTTWQKFLPPTYNIIRHHDLFGITISPTGEVWAVGAWNNYGVLLNLAYRWDGTAWTKVLSDNPSPSSNQLNDVTTDSQGNVYAVGKSDFKPLILKWNGIRFLQQPISNNLGGWLVGVSFSSPTNGWAVGGNYAYHFDGSTWTGMQIPKESFKATDVYSVSDNEAWVVGVTGVGTPTMMHYTTAGGWVQDTSFPYYPTLNYNIQAVDGTGPNDIWVSGNFASNWLKYQNVAATAHFDGTKWTWVWNPYSNYGRIEEIIALTDGVLAIGNGRQFMSYDRP